MAGDSQPGNVNNPQGNNFALAGGNWRHYVDATKVLHEFLDEKREGQASARALHPPAENTWKPKDDYLCCYCDLLGFSEEMRTEGMDSLPDFYGAAFVVAGRHPSTKVYLLSDSFIAFSPADDAAEFIETIQSAIANWRADGLIPQCSIGYGTFVERRPFLERTADNFFGAPNCRHSFGRRGNDTKKEAIGKPHIDFVVRCSQGGKHTVDYAN